MTETKELKPRSFRIDEETAEKFKAISAELGNNQQQTLSKLIETYEFQKGKAVLTQKKSEIETFEKYVTILTRLYMDSLEHNENVTEAVQAEFEALLHSKDETIIGLQAQIKAAEEQAKAKVEEAERSRKENEESKGNAAKLQQELEEARTSHEAALQDKEALIQALTQALDGCKKDQESMEKATLERNAMATKQVQLQKEFSSLQLEYNALKARMEQEQLSHERELLQKEISFAKQLQEAEQKRKDEIDAYQEKYLELLNKLQEKPKPVRIVKAIKK